MINLSTDHICPNDALESARWEFKEVLVVGYNNEGELAANCSELDTDTMLALIERFKFELLSRG